MSSFLPELEQRIKRDYYENLKFGLFFFFEEEIVQSLEIAVEDVFTPFWNKEQAREMYNMAT